MMVNIARGLADAGQAVDFVTSAREAPFLDQLPASVRLHLLEGRTRAERIRWLADHVRRTRPRLVLSAKTRDDEVALAVKRQLGGDTRYWLRPGSAMSERWRAKGKHALGRWWEARRLRGLYRRADGIIAVSHGVAEDVAAITGLPLAAIRVIRNPTLTPEMEALAAAPLDHPWFAPGEPPVILGVGGLRTQKDFSTLIRAFAQVRAARPCRLVILGEGRQRARLLDLAETLGVGEDLALPGFDPNPYRYLARAALFALSSRWEGSPNVLTEALGLGIPVVATDCPSGPREILQNGAFGELVAVGDAEALAAAMRRTLEAPLPPERLREAVADYRLAISARRYLAAFGTLY
ncbi:MAG: glycosyltransferase [Chromatiaceae bacterium]|nr:glycosyltransferase [Chromatiaceae bacterium]